MFQGVHLISDAPCTGMSASVSFTITHPDTTLSPLASAPISDIAYKKEGEKPKIDGGRGYVYV